VWYLLYNLVLSVAFVAVLPALPLLFVLRTRYRTGFAQRLGLYPEATRRAVPTAARPVWIHAASVGEVRSAEPLVREFKRHAPARKVLISTFTATGNRIARQIPGVDAAIFLPLDFPWSVRRALNTFDPSLLVIVETEIWPNLLRAAFRRGIPALLLSGRLSQKALARYSRLRGFFCRVVNFFTYLGMQSPADAARIESLGAVVTKVAVVGSLKFAPRPHNDNWGKITLAKDSSRQLIVAGSCHRGEEEILIAAYQSARPRFPGLSLVLAPRHPERFAEVEKLLSKTTLNFKRMTQVRPEEYFAHDILLLDTLGDLPGFFAAADIAFIGGSLVDGGGHNLLEPARFQKPILFGPHMSNFRTIADEMKRSGAAVEVRDAAGLTHILIELLEDADRRRLMGERAARVAGANRDALMLNFRLAERYL
jgi:3-deoxy-D-manno-octulosonic-acid transferase